MCFLHISAFFFSINIFVDYNLKQIINASFLLLSLGFKFFNHIFWQSQIHLYFISHITTSI